MNFLFLWLTTAVLGYWIFKKIKQWKDLPPGPWGLPVVGYLPFIDRYHPHLTLTKLSKQFGPIYGISMGSIYAVVLSDHKLIREAFAKETFSGRAPLFLTHGLKQGNGMIFAEGPLWKDQRKLVTTWLKSYGMGKHSVSREKLDKRIASGIYELLENIDKSAGSPMDLTLMLTNSLGNVVNEIVFGFKFPPEDKTWKWLRETQEEGCHEIGVAGVVNILPFMRFFSSSIRTTIRMLLRGQAQTHRLYASIITRRRKMLGLTTPAGAEYPPHADLFDEHPEGHVKCTKYSKQTSKVEEHYFDPKTLIPTDGECILNSFLEEQKKRFDKGDASAYYVRDEQLHYLLADMFGAGLDTTSVTLSWFLLYMALYPDEQELIRKEILAVYPEDDEVDSDKLPHVMAALCETQRIRSIVPVGIPHGCMKDTLLGNYLVPKGAMVIPLQWALHTDPNVWEQPEEFRPSRFISSDGSLLKPQEFIPFQTGKRMCPGDELSRMVSCGLVVRLFRHRRVRLASNPPSPEEMRGKVGLTLSPPPVLYHCDLQES